MKMNIKIMSLIFVISMTADLQANSNNIVKKEVADIERAFAKSMADRDFEAFKSFLDDEAIFLAGKNEARGKLAVAERWKKYFDEEQAPFSWRPETVVVLDSGNLALSTGPVFNPEGQVVSYFTSTWRQNKPGDWKIIFDKGNKACPGNQVMKTQ